MREPRGPAQSFRCVDRLCTSVLIMLRELLSASADTRHRNPYPVDFIMSKSRTFVLGAAGAACLVSVLVAVPTDVKADQTDVALIEKATRDPVSVIRYAQLDRAQHTAANAYKISYNIVIDGGAACNGDVVTVARLATIAKGTRILSVSADTFTSGDIGKAIAV